jgi:hypothetical protein
MPAPWIPRRRHDEGIVAAQNVEIRLAFVLERCERQARHGGKKPREAPEVGLAASLRTVSSRRAPRQHVTATSGRR